MVALIGFGNIFHALFSIVVHGARHIMQCVGVGAVC